MIYYGKELYHHGILGQKWGIRRFQYPDGKYTPEGKKRRRVISEDERNYRKNKEKKYWEMTTRELEEFNRRTNAINAYNRNNKNIGEAWLNTVGNAFFNGSAQAISASLVAAALAYLKLKK